MTAIGWTRRLAGGADLPGSSPRVRRYRVRARIARNGDDVAIEDQDGEIAFSVDGRALQLQDTLVLRDPYDRPLYRVPPRAMHAGNSVAIERHDGAEAATVGRAQVGTMRERWSVAVPAGEPLRLRGSPAAHEYRIEARGRQVAEVSNRWFRQPFTYGVAVPPGEDDALLVAIALGVDRMVR